MNDNEIDNANKAAHELSMKIVGFLCEMGPEVHPALANVALAIALGAGIRTCAKPERLEQVLKSMALIIGDVARAGETKH